MLPLSWVSLLYLTSAVSSFDSSWHLSCLNFFKLKPVKFATGIFCLESDAVAFAKLFASREIQTNVIIPSNENYLEIWADSTLSGVAVVVDGSCEFSQHIVQLASSNRLLDLTRHWLIYLDKYYSSDEIQRVAYEKRPNMFNVEEFLNEGISTATHGEILQKFNAENNEEILRDFSGNVSYISSQKVEPENFLEVLATINANVDSEVTIAVPSFEDEDGLSYELYEFYRVTLFTEMLINRIGSLNNGTASSTKKNNHISSTNFRTNFNGALLRGLSPLLFIGYFSKTGELTTKSHDRFAHMGIDLHMVLEKMLNFRTVLKSMDVHGWVENGSFTGAIGLLHDQKAEISTTPLVMTLVRLPAMDVVSLAFRLKLGMIFRDPTLSQVTNIFVLPFSAEVWLCLCSFFLFTTVLLYSQMKSMNVIDDLKYWDILLYFTGAACQQGTELKVKTLSVGFTLIVFLLSSLFLFTAYTANIVALLQSPSNLIQSVKDIVDSTFEVGLLNHVYIRKLIEDDNTSVTMELKEKKIKPLGENAIMTVPEGVRRIRNGLFAFQCNFIEVYEEIGKVFNEYEKCGLKEVLDYEGSITSIQVAKRSPYKEIFKQKHLLIYENGFVTRAYRRWAPHAPTCKNDGGRFSSVGLVEVSPVFTFLTYGTVLAVVVLTIEIMIHFISSRKIRTKRNML